MDKGLKCDLPNFAASKFCPLLFHSFSIKEALSGMLVGKAVKGCKRLKKRLAFNPIHSQALGYAEYIRGEQIHPRTLAVNTAFILQGIQFFCPLNKYFILS